MDLCIRNGTVVFETGTQKADIYVDNGKIVGIYEQGSTPCAKQDIHRIIDADSLVVFPGCIDPHMHLGLYDDFDTDFRIDTRAAACGGLTTLVNYYREAGSYMNTLPPILDTAAKNSLVDFAFTLGIVADYHLSEVPQYVHDLGITSFKFYCGYQNRIPAMLGIPEDQALRLDRADMYEISRVLSSVRSDDGRSALMCIHCEDAEIFNKIGEHMRLSGTTDGTLETFARTRPDFAETLAVMNAMYINRVTGGRLYIVHLSSASSVGMIENFRNRFPSQVTVETCPQYLLLNDTSECNLKGKVYPPMKRRADSDALWNGLKSGTVNTMGTDNCPIHLSKKTEKGNGMWEVLPGFPGAGYILPALISEGYHKRGLSLERIAQVTSINTARAFNLDSKGAIRLGADADFAIVDLDWERPVCPEIYGNCDFSVYDGMSFKGWPRYTVSRGEVIQENGKITAESGRGQFIKRSL